MFSIQPAFLVIRTITTYYKSCTNRIVQPPLSKKKNASANENSQNQAVDFQSEHTKRERSGHAWADVTITGV